MTSDGLYGEQATRYLYQAPTEEENLFYNTITIVLSKACSLLTMASKLKIILSPERSKKSSLLCGSTVLKQ